MTFPSSMEGVLPDPGSFRDRSNRVFKGTHGVFRGLTTGACQDWRHLSSSQLFSQFTASGKLIRSELMEGKPVTGSSDYVAWLRHERVRFISYPYEWSFGMLKDAALLQLELLLAALDEGMTLKDGSPYNVQWFGARPVFIDTPSFTQDGADAPWAGYTQFCRLCLYPLLLTAYKNVPFHPWLKGSLEGIDVEAANRMFSMLDCLRPGIFAHVYLQAKLATRYSASRRDLRQEVRDVGFNRELVRINARRLHKLVSDLEWNSVTSTWSHYTDLGHYSDKDAEEKRAFVVDVLGQHHRSLVWDLGCNTGGFSELAMEHADYVVAMDADHLAVERLYQRLKSEQKENILPLIMDLSDPSPNRGWRCMERSSLSFRGQPDLILCLALIHHMVISANVPLSELIAWFADLGEELVIEFVAKDDPMVKKLLLNKHDQYDDYTLGHFERCLQQHFKIQKRYTLAAGTRTLYYAIK